MAQTLTLCSPPDEMRRELERLALVLTASARLVERAGRSDRVQLASTRSEASRRVRELLSQPPVITLRERDF